MLRAVTLVLLDRRMRARGHVPFTTALNGAHESSGTWRTNHYTLRLLYTTAAGKLMASCRYQTLRRRRQRRKCGEVVTGNAMSEDEGEETPRE